MIISNYKFEDGTSDRVHISPITIPSGNTLLFHEKGGLGISDQNDGTISFLMECPDGCEILFEDGNALHFRPVEAYYQVDASDFETHSPYSPYSHEFEMLEKGFCSTHGRMTCVITDDDHD